ncbi:(2Fe-2S) ferredoxin domain-containing protein [Aminivibrio sp.]|jgi:NADP-reducing hydrogenase subunit HndB|uniref:(2Fe-2S) ferredoxin domain-containing protein n=1 Tax=Aminivibrio sp. TaxID=1872489 RepID=UPI0016965BE1|nr:(2Fe-2S) ferredoxin domain-containing protein [Synergistaceae bacterium]MDD3389980.1 (2Fe-2S) ferredoxin domain-containing protein [Synergistaceae bacterium]MDD4021920.1 (2Fe-2S) ferredoxin domain-containing protein [Synergistaceae bacterium]MDD4613020.1 (2Fe-2S) ferredoxin domain-containing protein [Synergistaceae bacterium]NLO59258.1 (2Fe-2S) ferredoxin domain-containing protein [Synergistaceae bacterium]
MTGKIRSLDDLRKLKEKSGDLTSARSEENKVKIIIGMGTCGIAAGAREIMSAVLRELETRNLHNVAVETTGCIGMCQNEPLLDVIRPGEPRITYCLLKPQDVSRIVSEHVVNGRIVQDKLFGRAE